jgi:hypothetical protein
MNQLIPIFAVVGLFLWEAAVFLYRVMALKGQSRSISPATMIGLSAIVTSILFTASALVMICLTDFAVSSMNCDAAILTCVVLYTATKAQLYLFFVERIHVVHKTLAQTRSNSPFYWFNICLLLPYVGVAVLMFLYRTSHVSDQSNNCRIGLERESTIPMLVYDTLFSTYAVAAFVWPLFKKASLTSDNEDVLILVGRKNIIGSIVSTISSFLNVFTVYYNDTKTADNCLMHCAIDVMVNVLVMNYLIKGSDKKNNMDNNSVRPSLLSRAFSSSGSFSFPIITRQNSNVKVIPASDIRDRFSSRGSSHEERTISYDRSVMFSSHTCRSSVAVDDLSTHDSNNVVTSIPSAGEGGGSC